MKSSKSLEGEIILREKYGSSSQERLYIKPPEQNNIVVLSENKYSDITGFFSRIFLPQGYPKSVSKDYMAYQVWDTAQAFCSTITGTLATQEVLRGVGVGDTSATPLAATITWVIKDGCGHLGRILFAFSHGTYLDAYSKKWRLYADTLNDAAMCIEMALPLFKNYTTFALCISTVMKAIVGVAGGATRTAMTQHHAVRGNLADIAAKDSAQETAVNLIASITALLIITVFGNSVVIFVIMIVFHIIFNYFAVRAVCLRTLNEPRFLQVISKYLTKEVIASPCEINRTEPIIFYQLGPSLLDLKVCGFQIKLGYSLQKLVKHRLQAAYLNKVRDVYDHRSYILVPHMEYREMFILLREGVSTDDILSAYFHAVLLSIIICAINDYSLAIYTNVLDPRPFTQVCHTLQSAEWSREPYTGPSRSGFIHEPSVDLLVYVDNIAQREWHRVKLGLEHTGWDLKRHLIMVDEWRLHSENIIKPLNVSQISSLDLSRTKRSTISFANLLKNRESDSDKAYTIEPDPAKENIKPSTDLKQNNDTTEKATSSTNLQGRSDKEKKGTKED